MVICVYILKSAIILTKFLLLGIKRFCEDILFMVGLKTGLYWRLCWGIITPGLMLAVLIYTLIDLKPLTYKNVDYPQIAHGWILKYYLTKLCICYDKLLFTVFGWCLSALSLFQIPGWALYQLWCQDKQLSLRKVG